MKGLLVKLRLLATLILFLAAPAFVGAAQDAEDAFAARQNYQFLIEQTHIAYPGIPAGLLESQAWVATRWQHRVPDEAESHRGMPQTYGLFGLYSTNEFGFVDLLGEVASFRGLSKQELMSSEQVYVDATAAWLEDQIINNGLEGQRLEAFRPVVERLSGIAPASEAAQFAVQSHVYEVYQTAGHGVNQNAVSIKPQLIDLAQVFSAPELERLGAPEVLIDVGNEKVAGSAPKKKSASFFAGSARILDQVNVDYPDAIWNASPNFNSRTGTAISHVVIHTMQGSYSGSINWFLNTASQVSSHYLMRSSDGQITQMVRNSDRAWHARSANSYSVGIEHEGFVDNPDWYTDEMYDESARMTAYLCAAHSIDCSQAYDGVSHSSVVEISNAFTVKGHQHYPEQVHSDPGINWDWPRYYALLNGGVTPPSVNRLPEARFSADCTGLVCQFDASGSSDADGAVVSYSWDYGDSATGSSMTSSHQYAAAGSYAVELSVTDDQGAVHQTISTTTVQNTVTPSMPAQKGGGGAASIWFLLLVLTGLSACSKGRIDDAPKPLELPVVSATAYHSIAARIFANETQSNTRYLTYWGAGEDFPSLGIGHFIWFPEGVDAPFDETFPSMVQYVREHGSECATLPGWLENREPLTAPWQSKQQFDELQDSVPMTELRQWLVDTASVQARFIVASFVRRWNELELPSEQKRPLTETLQQLVQTSQGLSAVVDYYNFKGLGSNPRERYNDEGWGLVQVLGEITKPAKSANAENIVTRFSDAAADRLRLRVSNAPPERNESRWLEGWMRRVADYAAGSDQFAVDATSHYRVTPYLQNPSPTGMTLVWFSDRATPGKITLSSADAKEDISKRQSQPTRACELAYHLAEYRNIEVSQTLPFRHVVEIDKLEPGNQYTYTVDQDGEMASGTFRTPADDSSIRFVVYGDSETEPESTGKHASWPVSGNAGGTRRYLVDQSDGYEANLDVIGGRRPDFVAIAGDLVQSGGEQRDWDEFWRHNARLGATTPIVAAAGNHDYFGGPGDLGQYSVTGAGRAIGKFQSYFPVNTYYSVDYGPAVVIVIDANSGSPERSDGDTNWYLKGESVGGIAPAWQAGSVQADWLEETLADAQRDRRAAFVLFHPAPYTSGIHGKPPGLGDAENFSSSLPLRALTPTFMRYGVAAVFNGHDEMYEHSIVDGTATLLDGREVDHEVHFFTIGIGGDGLRGAEPGVENPYRKFLADTDATEEYDDGVLIDGGKHYGHLEVNLQVESDGSWQANIEPVYVFPVTNSAGEVQGFERRVYDDITILNANDD